MDNDNNNLKWLADTHIMRCKVCNNKVPVNVNYPIHEVTCKECWSKQQREHTLVGN